MRWPDGSRFGLAAAIAVAVAMPAAANAQHPGQGHAAPPAPADTVHATHAHEAMPMMHAARGHAHEGAPAFYGRYAISREASGTAWQPESSPHTGWHVMRGPWSLMLHGFAFVVADRQGGARGDDRLFSTSMLMGMASRPAGPGRLGLRTMVSLEPLTVGKRGYPLLLQTGETADGRTHLIDRQHPHDLFMELAAVWTVSDATRSAFVYAGLPGEPALGPPVFMHRYSGESNPESPIGHHWLDSSHITFGVATVGLVHGAWKLEGSAFRGREPDQDRSDIETPKLDSYATRMSWNPTPDWALQASAGRLESPEQLAPEVDTHRATVSAMWSRLLPVGRLSAMAAWGRNRNRPGAVLDALLLEGAGEFGRHAVFARVERTEKDELFPDGDPRAEDVFNVGRLSGGYIREVLRTDHLELGAGAMGGAALVPDGLKGVYGDTPLSASLFVRARLR
ncbi:MAG: hypothetical protein ACRENJ_00035 [Candidatus Eiseniibacteriota bacterium]